MFVNDQKTAEAKTGKPKQNKKQTGQDRPYRLPYVIK
jgi:hypothetical protein